MMIICNDILLMGKRYYSFGIKHKLGDRSLVFILPALAQASLYEGAGFYWGMRIGVIIIVMIIIIMSLFKDLNNDYYWHYQGQWRVYGTGNYANISGRIKLL